MRKYDSGEIGNCRRCDMEDLKRQLLFHERMRSEQKPWICPVCYLAQGNKIDDLPKKELRKIPVSLLERYGLLEYLCNKGNTQ